MFLVFSDGEVYTNQRVDIIKNIDWLSNIIKLFINKLYLNELQIISCFLNWIR